MEKLLSVQINIVLALLLIILLVHAFKNMNKTMLANRVFMWIMGFTCLCLLLEIADVMLNTSNLKQYYAVHLLVNLIGFIIAPTVPYLGCVFIKEWLNRFERNRINQNRAIILPLIINILVTMLSVFGYGAFGMTHDSIYYRGELFWILPVVSYFYFAYSLYFIYQYRNKITVIEQILFSLFYIIVAFFTAIQLANGTFLTIWNSSAFISIVIYIFILDDQAYRDALTGLSNRLFYDRYIQNFNYRKEHNIVAVYIDLDKFKMINDQHGHCEGDDAIRIFAKLLKDCFSMKHKKIIRVGGDEFLILIKELPFSTVERKVEELKKEILQFNQTGEKPYQLSFSYGIASYDKSYHNISQFFEHTDHLMYGNKNKTIQEINNFS